MGQCFPCRSNVHSQCEHGDCACKFCKDWSLDDKHLQLGDHTK